MLNKAVKKRIFFVFVIVIAVLFIAYQIVIYALNGIITTEAAIPYSVYDEITADTLFFRDETVIDKTADGVYNYVISNGEKVAKSGTIASVYKDEASVEKKLKIDMLQKKKNELVSVQSTGINYFADVDLINSKINSDLFGILNISDGRNLDGLSEYSDDLIKQFNKKQITTGAVIDFNDLIYQIDAEIETLSAALSEPVSEITSPESGFFVNYSDGFESVYIKDVFDSMTVADLEQMFKASPVDVSASAGKVITENKWYMVSLVTADEASLMNIGDTVKVYIPQCSVSDLEASVENIITDEEIGKAAVIMSCATVTDNLVTLRNETVQIHANNYSGIKVSTRAIRVVDAKQGVYVLNKNEAHFKPVDIIYSSVDYVICTVSGQEDSLAVYNEIITEGSNLYEGKVVK